MQSGRAGGDRLAHKNVDGPLRLTADGWIDDAALIAPSPNHDARPRGEEIEVVILHAISLPPRRYGGDAVERLFTNRLDRAAHPGFADLAGLKVSAHFFIRRDGSLRQFVSTAMRAWHAGVSSCLGRGAVNDFSIGIELEGCDEEAFTRCQYESLDVLADALQRRYPRLSRDRYFGHSDVAPGRKTDPGPWFQWRRFRQRAA